MLIITGASGFVGRHLMLMFNSRSPAQRQGYDILPVYHSNAIDSGKSVDLSNTAEVKSLCNTHRITAVIHLAAEARPAECEKNPDSAFNKNVTATRNLLNECSKSLPYFLYVSTDMVFNGDRGTYHESDVPDSTGVYGRTKAMAESLVQEYNGRWCIVRPSLVYGADIAGRKSCLSWTLDTIRSKNGHFYRDEIRTPVWVNDLVSLLYTLCESRHQGIVHAGGLRQLSRLDFANITADVWEIPRENIRSIELGNDAANKWRPRDLSLVSETAHNLGSFTDVRSSLLSVRSEWPYII